MSDGLWTIRVPFFKGLSMWWHHKWNKNHLWDVTGYGDSEGKEGYVLTCSCGKEWVT